MKPVALSAYDVSARTLRSDEYWVVPNLDPAPSTQDLLEAGLIRRADLWGKVVAITGPAERRRLFQREPARGGIGRTWNLLTCSRLLSASGASRPASYGRRASRAANPR